MSLKQQANKGSEVDEQLAALITNSNAVRAISSSVEGTLGPKGLDTMLVDRYGDVVITNDGVTILTLMEANHPAARMLINVARAQQDEIGDGTTTATIMAGTMVSTGVDQVARGVPVARVIEGLRFGFQHGLRLMQARVRPVDDMDDPVLKQVALVAGRGYLDIADLVVEAARLVGKEKIVDPNFKFSDTVVAEEGSDNKVFSGVIINKEPVSRQTPKKFNHAGVLVIDDALEPEEIEPEALATEVGFNLSLELKEHFKQNLQKLASAGVSMVLVDRSVHDLAEEILTDAGIMVVERVSNRELHRAAEHTGARIIKRTALKRSINDICGFLGRTDKVFHDEKLKQVWLTGGQGKPMATVLVGAATAEVVGERERIARDAASAVQASLRGGVVPGGGSLELAVAREIEREKAGLKGMTVFGVDCVIEALKRPMSQIVANAGFNPLEKMGDVTAAQVEAGLDSLGIDCDSGTVSDMYRLGVIDPAPVKTYAFKAAGEIAEAILRIDTIIKKKEEQEGARVDVDKIIPQ